MGTRFIYEETLSGLAEGSLEHLRFLVGESLSTLFPGVKSRILFVFPTSAVVVTENDGLHRVRFERVGTKLRGVVTEAISLPEDQDPVVARMHAGEVLSMLESGLHSDAQSAMKALLCGSSLRRSDGTPFEELVKRDRAWKKRVQERSSEMERFIGRGARLLEMARPSLRCKGGAWTPALEASWKVLRERVEVLYRLAEVTRGSWKKQLPSLMREDKCEFMKPFEALCDDFFDDLASVHHALEESARVVSNPIHLGRMHDALAEEIQKFELVGVFTSETMKRFQDLRR